MDFKTIPQCPCMVCHDDGCMYYCDRYDVWKKVYDAFWTAYELCAKYIDEQKGVKAS